MGGYWTRHRLCYSLIASCIVALITSILFAYPFVNQRAENYNAQSIYKKSQVDFIVPEPSFEQVAELPGSNGIDEVFPFYITKSQVDVKGKSRNTNVLLSDQFDAVDFTMYGDARVLEKANSPSAENIAYVDWNFAKDTGVKAGDTVSVAINSEKITYTVVAICEANTVYDGGVILLKISDEQKNAINQNASNNGYSGMYVKSSDYNKCRTYLTTEYRPLGRLKDKTQFDSEEQYQLHYDAIMSSAFANEITDFRIQESNAKTEANYLLIIIAAVFSLVAVIAFNMAMFNRGVEKVYFTKNSIPKGQKVLPYYNISFIFEMIVMLVVFCATLLGRATLAKVYIPKNAFSPLLIIIPAAFVFAEYVSLKFNQRKIKAIEVKVKEQQKKEREKKAQEQNKTER